MKKKWMGELKTIMEQKDPNVRRQKLSELAILMGVSVAGIATANGVIEENLIIERIEQRILLHTAVWSWKIALISAIASLISALSALIAVIYSRAG